MRFCTICFYLFICISTVSDLNAQGEKLIHRKYAIFSFIVDTTVWHEANSKKLFNKINQDSRVMGRMPLYQHLFTLDTLSDTTIPFFTFELMTTQSNFYNDFKTKFNNEFISKTMENNKAILDKYINESHISDLKFDDKKKFINVKYKINRHDGAALVTETYMFFESTSVGQFNFVYPQNEALIYEAEVSNIAGTFNWSSTPSQAFWKLKDHFTFVIPLKFELQGGLLSPELKKQYTSGKILLENNKVILQQKGLNSFEPESLNKYARIIANPVDSNDYNEVFKKSTISEMNKMYMELAKTSLLSNTTFLQSFPPASKVKKGKTWYTFKFERKMDERIPVTVEHNFVQHKGKWYSFLCSYKTEDSNYWRKSIDEFLNSIKF